MEWRKRVTNCEYAVRLLKEHEVAHELGGGWYVSQ